jgi:hypothetical protein
VYVKMYYANEDRQEFERNGVIENVTQAMLDAARAVARLDMSLDGTMCADVHADNGDILDVLVFTRQMRDRVVAELRQKN